MIKCTLTLAGESDVVRRFANEVGEASPTPKVVGSVEDGVLSRSVTTDTVKWIADGTWEVDGELWATVEATCSLVLVFSDGDEREDVPNGFAVAVGCNVDVGMVP